jgi:proteasome lid subunit RPN8/RPN11
VGALRPQSPPEIDGLRQTNIAVVYPHVFATPDREVGGVLIGRASRHSLPLITGAIPAIQADERRDSLTFTQDTWEHVHRTLEREFPDGEQIVGWYHSHPGFGIFLSEHDLFIHRNFFSGTSQIALVVDPHATTEGVFVWHEGTIVPLFERQTSIRPSNLVSVQWVPNVPRAPLHARSEHAPSHRLAALIVAMLLGILLGLAAWQLLPFGGSDDSASTRTRPTAAAFAPAGHTSKQGHGGNRS